MMCWFLHMKFHHSLFAMTWLRTSWSPTLRSRSRDFQSMRKGSHTRKVRQNRRYGKPVTSGHVITSNGQTGYLGIYNAEWKFDCGGPSTSSRFEIATSFAVDLRNFLNNTESRLRLRDRSGRSRQTPRSLRRPHHLHLVGPRRLNRHLSMFCWQLPLHEAHHYASARSS